MKLGQLIKPTINLIKIKGKSTTEKINSVLGISSIMNKITRVIYLMSSIY